LQYKLRFAGQHRRKVSGREFSEFISENIFIPCHMYHSRARSAADSTIVSNLALSYMGTKWERIGEVPYDGVMGDKGIFTTTYDLYLFDQALNHGLLLHEETLAEAYKGYSYEKPGQKNYGLGWRIRELAG
jgi:CubicO group peptidase (beta-lactamase class C family)